MEDRDQSVYFYPGFDALIDGDVLVKGANSAATGQIIAHNEHGTRVKTRVCMESLDALIRWHALVFGFIEPFDDRLELRDKWRLDLKPKGLTFLLQTMSN